MQARAGYAVASDGAYLAALTTELTPELVREGLAREFVRRVQDLRKIGRVGHRRPHPRQLHGDIRR